MKIENASSWSLVVQRKCHFFLAGHRFINKLQVLTLKKERNFIKETKSATMNIIRKNLFSF